MLSRKPSSPTPSSSLALSCSTLHHLSCIRCSSNNPSHDFPVSIIFLVSCIPLLPVSIVQLVAVVVIIVVIILPSVVVALLNFFQTLFFPLSGDIHHIWPLSCFPLWLRAGWNKAVFTDRTYQRRVGRLHAPNIIVHARAEVIAKLLESLRSLGDSPPFAPFHVPSL